VRIRNFFDNAYVFLGLYLTTFFSVSGLLSPLQLISDTSFCFATSLLDH